MTFLSIENSIALLAIAAPVSVALWRATRCHCGDEPTASELFTVLADVKSMKADLEHIKRVLMHEPEKK